MINPQMASIALSFLTSLSAGIVTGIIVTIFSAWYIDHRKNTKR